MSEPVDVLFALTADVRRNSRAIRQLDALAELGCSVAVLTFGPEAAGVWRGMRLHVLPKPPGGGPGFFRAVHRQFRDAALRLPARVYHASDLFALPALHAAARRHGARLAYDSRELYPYVGATAGKPWARLFWFAVERRHIRHADAVFTVSASIAERMARMYGIERPELVLNVPPYRTVARSNLLRKRLGIPEELPVVLYQGNLKRWRGCEQLAAAMRDVPGTALVFMGDGELEGALREIAAAAGAGDRVYFTPPIPPDELLPVTASADIGYTVLDDVSLSQRFALPNKIFEYLMAGVPVLGSDLPEIRRIVETYDVGRVIPPSNPAALAEALREMVSNAEARRRWSANAPRVFEEYNWEASAGRLKDAYRRLLEMP